MDIKGPTTWRMRCSGWFRDIKSNNTTTFLGNKNQNQQEIFIKRSQSEITVKIQISRNFFSVAKNFLKKNNLLQFFPNQTNLRVLKSKAIIHMQLSASIHMLIESFHSELLYSIIFSNRLNTLN